MEIDGVEFEGWVVDDWETGSHYVISAVGDNIYGSRDGVPVGLLDFPTYEVAEHFVEMIKAERKKFGI